jgi:hypothetical protein
MKFSILYTFMPAIKIFFNIFPIFFDSFKLGFQHAGYSFQICQTFLHTISLHFLSSGKEPEPRSADLSFKLNISMKISQFEKEPLHIWKIGFQIRIPLIFPVFLIYNMF